MTDPVVVRALPKFTLSKSEKIDNSNPVAYEVGKVSVEFLVEQMSDGTLRITAKVVDTSASDGQPWSQVVVATPS